MAPPDPWLDLTAAAWGEIPGRPLRFYLHVPYCTHRCDYCDFTTYTPDDPRGRGQAQWLPGVRTELALAARVLPAALAGPVHSIFIGGGTPTLLAPETLGVAIADIADRWGLVADCEITVEANPETITPSLAAGLLAAGVTRVSVGMQSAVPAVLGTLGRLHRPSTMVTAIECLRRAGLQRLSVDLIYGAEGESLAQWQVSVQAALDLGVGHISAYGLIVEPGTALAARVARGVTRPPDDEDLAIKYELADAAFEAAGLRWYEIANWARPGEQCAHNSGYWRADTWWGVGPGAHSHLGGVRWWNRTNPHAWQVGLADVRGDRREARWPVAGWELLSAEQRVLEQAMCTVRLRRPWPVPGNGRLRAALVAEGLVVPVGVHHASLTRRGRLLADHVVHRTLDAAGECWMTPASAS